ncbi:MAG: carbohydrate kinase family protein [Chloroflexi bacterium]|nr:carbohydrate kinase family protein [Chloroflexota bacterium]
MKPFDLLVAGEINPDLILTGDVIPAFNQVEKLVDSATLTIGSSSVIFACGAARLGLKIAFIGVCGNDVFGKFMLDEMHKRKVDVSNVIVRSSGQTGLSVILNQDADRAILTHPGLIADLRAADLADSLLHQSRHLHVASYFLQTKLQPDLPNLFQRAHSLGLTTSLDTNYDPSEQWRGFDELLSVTDVFLPNQTEALSITKSGDVESAARQLAEKTKLVAVKLGADGALACSGSPLPVGEGLGVREITRADSISVNVVDTVGAGDSFDAGFIYGYLNNWQIEKSLRLACVCGALSTQQAGGTDGQPTLEEAMKYVPG